MREWADHTIEEAGGRTTVVVTGPLLVSTIGKLDAALRKVDGPVQFVDISRAHPVDTVGAWVIHRFAEEQSAEVLGASQQAEVLIDTVTGSASEAPISPQLDSLLTRVPEQLGDFVTGGLSETKHTIGFLGGIIMAFGSLIRHPRRFRLRALVHQMELVGVTSLPIIGLMSFLIGIVIAQQGAVQLQQFGAETLTVNLVGRITLRELGVLMTAIMVAGRSGSAFAAQLGTMKLTEEIDAMRTIGVSPMEALVVPRILAAVL
ncbi:MAG TPA: ABC transporter permease, partial [Paracoccaceae bacterium]|nr:ABC transporter permease [Paracoccaceae bacterium]